MQKITRFERSDFLPLCCIAPFSTDSILLKGISKQTTRSNGRRVVTGINSEGKSIILSNGVIPEKGRHGVIWSEDQVPVDLSKNSESHKGYPSALTLEPPQGGFTAHVLTLEPGFYGEFHQTKTIDFVFIISGKLELILEENSTILSSGDTVIQRGTNHAWRVIGEEPCMLAAVMVSAIKN